MSTPESLDRLTLFPLHNIISRIDGALDRLKDAQGIMRIPADPADPDLVLVDCRTIILHVLAFVEKVKP
jgi:hypothetical protein